MFSHMDGFSEMHKYTVPCGSGSQQCSGRGWYRFSQLSGTHWWVDIDVEIASLVGSGSEVEVFGVADGFKSRKGHFISIQLPLQPQKGSDCRGVWTIQSPQVAMSGVLSGHSLGMAKSSPFHRWNGSSQVNKWRGFSPLWRPWRTIGDTGKILGQYPIGSMYGTGTYIWLIFMVNVRIG